MTKPNYNERKALKTVLTKWGFHVTEIGKLRRGACIIDDAGEYRVVAATMAEASIVTDQGGRVFLAFEDDPEIQVIDCNHLVIQVNVTRSAEPKPEPESKPKE